NRVSAGNFIYNAPLWLIFLVAGWLFILIAILTDPIYSNIFGVLSEGIPMTLRVAATAYIMALMIGLFVGLVRSEKPVPLPRYPSSRMRFRYWLHLMAYRFSKYTGRGSITKPTPLAPTPSLGMRIRNFLRLILYHILTLYVEIMRGLPILIVLLLTAFVIFPELRDKFLEPLLGHEIETRGGSPEPAIIALALTYGAFISETFRAGIQSIEKGQMEAAKSLGMTYFQAMRLVILPQAIRRVLPPLGNDVIAMIKDSSLVSVLGVQDVTQIARTSSGRSFRYLATYLTVAFIYLTLTIVGSFFVKWLERYLKNQQIAATVTNGEKRSGFMFWFNRQGRGPGGAIGR
ncbi:MAG TPA: amino acid ABC transporter permease, partial [Phototrophicaceae bacterium]|nr:amino acid ABC transporter permease [Phototrophicaceae bacterium]